MTEPSEVVSHNPDGTSTLADGRVVRLIAGRRGVMGYREVEAGSVGEHAASGVDQVGSRPVPTMREALS